MWVTVALRNVTSQKLCWRMSCWHSNFIKMSGPPLLSMGGGAGVVMPKLTEPVASCAGCPWDDCLGSYLCLHVQLPKVGTNEESNQLCFISDQPFDPLWASIIVGKHCYHVLSGQQLCLRSMKIALIGLPEMTRWRPKSTMQLHLQTVNLCRLRCGSALHFLKTGQDCLRCSDGSLVWCSSLSAVLLSNPEV